MKKRVIISLIVAVAVSMCVVLTSCGETNEKSSTPSSSSVEQSDIVSGTESVTEEETLAESTTEKTLAEEDPSEETTEEKEFAGTTKEKASALAITEAKEDGFSETFRVIYAKHTTVDGEDTWKIILADKNNSSLVAYVKGEECFLDNTKEEDFADSTEKDAIMIALSNVGDGVWETENTEMITYPNGNQFWQVVLKSENGDIKVAHVNGADCYFDNIDSDGRIINE